MSEKDEKKKERRFETNTIHAVSELGQHQEHSRALYMTSAYRFSSVDEGRQRFAGEENGFVYTRVGGPNNQDLAQSLAYLEGCDTGIATSTGMSAMFLALVSLAAQGDHIIASRSLFGSTHVMLSRILSRWGITHTFVDGDDPAQWEQALQDTTKVFIAETPANPMLEIVDLSILGEFCKSNNLTLVVDNTFATPYLQNPAHHGADIVIHSTTKFIDGQGRALGGVILGPKKMIEEAGLFSTHIGTTASPFNSWIFSKSLESLPVRMERHCDNALEIARFLEGQKQVKSVRYPFLESHPAYETARKQMRMGGGVVTFEIEDKAEAFMDSLSLVTIAANLGDSRTIITHPSSTTHSKLTEEERLAAGITERVMRLSVGLEHVEDIKEDLQRAFDIIK